MTEGRNHVLRMSGWWRFHHGGPVAAVWDGSGRSGLTQEVVVVPSEYEVVGKGLAVP